MRVSDDENPSGDATDAAKRSGFLLDLVLYLGVMFLIREIPLPQVHFIAQGLFFSFTTLLVASWRMRVRGITWRDLGMRRPRSTIQTLLIAGGILLAVVASMVAVEILKDQVTLPGPADQSDAAAVSKFGDLAGNWGLFLLILFPVLLESALEELLDRGFLLSWLERAIPGHLVAIVAAVLLQAMIFGFRHSYDLSERSITVGIIGLIMGTAYVLCGRNLWPLILAHCALNTLSMLGRVL